MENDYKIPGERLLLPAKSREEEGLDRALVAGLLLEAVIAEAPLRGDSLAARGRVKARLKDTLVNHLAGRVSLERFRDLAGNLEHWFSFYYPLLSPVFPPPGDSWEDGPMVLKEPSPEPWGRPVLQEGLMEIWLGRLKKVLPHRSHRKLNEARLLSFLNATRGGWFRLKDFEIHFSIDRKTGWEYLQKFLEAGLLCHNLGRSSAVRYCLNPRFLVVEADTLRLGVALALLHLPESVVEQAADGLIATGGAPFWEEAWMRRLPPGRARLIMDNLAAADVVEVISRSEAGRLFRLHRRWLVAPGEGKH